MEQVTKEFIRRISQELDAGKTPTMMVDAFNQFTNALFSIHRIEIEKKEQERISN